METAEVPAMSDEPDSQDSFERWLQEAGATNELSVAAMAAAMSDDGVDAGEANLLAAAAVLRHGGGPLSRLFQDARQEDAALVFAQYLRGVRAASCGSQAPISARHRGNTVELAGNRIASIRLRCRAPEIMLFDDVLTAAECAALIETARNGLTQSHVLGADDASVNTVVRSSSGTFVDSSQGSCIAIVEERCAELLGWPLACCESLEVTRYLPGQHFSPHVDYFESDDYAAHARALDSGGQRLGTLILYLSDVPAGGATAFEHAGIEFCPKQGSALYFGYAMSDGKMDLASMHQGLPVERGEKWIATLWLRERAARPQRS